jgi:hypothetical protein
MGRRRSKLVGPPDDVAVSPAYVGEMDSRDWVRLAPLALATMASQALLVVLGPIRWLSEPIWVRRLARSGRRDP